MTEACTSGVVTGFVALGYARVALLGIVQGLAELLPISSTAHMRIVPALLARSWLRLRRHHAARRIGRGHQLFLTRASWPRTRSAARFALGLHFDRCALV